MSRLLVALALTASALVSVPAQAQDWPLRPETPDSAGAQAPIRPSAPAPAAQPAPASPVPVQPQDISVDPTAHRHGGGLLLRLELGGGYLKSTEDLSPSLIVKGAGVQFGVLLGGAVSENLVLGGHFWAIGSVSPTVQRGSVESSTSSDTTNTLVGVGLNLTYYLMPANVYLSVSPSLTRLVMSDQGASASSDAGFGVNLALGKEFWVGDQWGLGLAGQFIYSSNNDKDGGPKISSLGGVLVLSLTYN